MIVLVARYMPILIDKTQTKHWKPEIQQPLEDEERDAIKNIFNSRLIFLSI